VIKKSGNIFRWRQYLPRLFSSNVSPVFPCRGLRFLSVPDFATAQLLRPLALSA
jgi:hypothetical protein